MATSSSMPVRVAVDIGGTFTDIVVMSGDGALHESKVSTTPDEPSRAVVAGVDALLRELDVAPARMSKRSCTAPRSAPTPSCSASGARTGLITTRGFRDVLEIGRIRMPDMFDLTWDKPKPLVPRRHRLEVVERIAADGSVGRAAERGERDRGRRAARGRGSSRRSPSA